MGRSLVFIMIAALLLASNACAAAVGQPGFDVMLTEVGENKDEVIKVLQELPLLGQKTAEDLVSRTPVIIYHYITESMAKDVVTKLQNAGATVETWEVQFNVVLAEAGKNRVKVIEVVRELTGLGLKESKALVDSTPAFILQGVSLAQAKDAELKLESEGAIVDVKEVEYNPEP